MIVLSLKQVLASRNYCDLGALAHLHGLPMSRSRPKAQSIQRLYAHIRQHKTMMRAYRALTRRAKEALAILKACGSSLPFALFRRMYGDKMPYRPWRGDDAPTWGDFASITDMLWRLGMIDIQVGNPTRVLLVDDVRPLLPDMPLPQPMMAHAIPDGRAIVLHDLTEWLAGASARPIRLKKGRWLPIQTLRRIEKGCLMGDDMTTIRGETRTTRLRWYHYLADVAGFITHNETGIHLTVRAWEWLGWSDSDRWAHLLGAMWDDWRSDNPLWRAYHLPDIQFEAWDALYRHVVACDVGMYARDDMESAFRPYLAIHPAFMPMRWRPACVFPARLC